jgi:hypothetical protein
MTRTHPYVFRPGKLCHSDYCELTVTRKTVRCFGVPGWTDTRVAAIIVLARGGRCTAVR